MYKGKKRKVSLVGIVAIEVVLGIICSLVAGVLFFKITDNVIDQDTAFFDQVINTIIYSFRSPGLTELMKSISFIGMDGILVFSMLIPLFLWIKKHNYQALIFGLMIGMGVIINYLLKLIIQRERPEGLSLVVESTYSFPSGHSMNSFIFFMTVAIFVFKFSKSKRLGMLAFVVAVAMISLVGFSRIYLGVHYSSDIIGGYVAGGLWMVTFYAIEKSFTWARLLRNR